MSDSSALHTMQTNPAHQHLESLNFEIKKLNTAHDILETLKKQCIAFQSFPDLQTECFKVFFCFFQFIYVISPLF